MVIDIAPEIEAICEKLGLAKEDVAHFDIFPGILVAEVYEIPKGIVTDEDDPEHGLTRVAFVRRRVTT